MSLQHKSPYDAKREVRPRDEKIEKAIKAKSLDRWCILTIAFTFPFFFLFVSRTSSDAKAQALCIEGCLRALLGDELPMVPFNDRPPHPDAVATLLEVSDMHRAHWTSLQAYQAFAAFSPAEFVDYDRKQRDEELAATAALASLSMVRRAVSVWLSSGGGGLFFFFFWPTSNTH